MAYRAIVTHRFNSGTEGRVMVFPTREELKVNIKSQREVIPGPTGPEFTDVPVLGSKLHQGTVIMTNIAPAKGDGVRNLAHPWTTLKAWQAAQKLSSGQAAHEETREEIHSPARPRPFPTQRLSRDERHI